MPVNCSVATEEENDVSLIGSGGHPDAPLDVLSGLEGLEVFRRTSQPEDGSSAHVRGRE
jgi:hypothetical protein